MEKQADGKVDKAKAESLECINQCLRASVWEQTTPARSRIHLGLPHQAASVDLVQKPALQVQPVLLL